MVSRAGIEPATYWLRDIVQACQSFLPRLLLLNLVWQITTRCPRVLHAVLPCFPLSGAQKMHRGYWTWWREMIVPRGRKGLESKTQWLPPAGSGIGIANVSMHTLSNFFCHKSFAKNFPPHRFGQKVFGIEIGRKFLKAKGLRYEKVDWAGMEMALGVYQDRE